MNENRIFGVIFNEIKLKLVSILQIIGRENGRVIYEG